MTACSSDDRLEIWCWGESRIVPFKSNLTQAESLVCHRSPVAWHGSATYHLIKLVEQTRYQTVGTHPVDAEQGWHSFGVVFLATW